MFSNFSKETIQFYANFVVLLTNTVIFITTLFKLKDSKIIINNARDLRRALSKPFEGVWKVTGDFEKYHGVGTRHISKGVAFFSWNENTERYDVYYNYSVEKSQSGEDIVTAICTGFANTKSNGTIGFNKK